MQKVPVLVSLQELIINFECVFKKGTEMGTVFVLEEQKEDCDRREKYKKQQLFVCSCIIFLTAIAFGLLRLFFCCLFVCLCVCLIIISQNTKQH